MSRGWQKNVRESHGKPEAVVRGAVYRRWQKLDPRRGPKREIERQASMPSVVQGFP